LNASGGLCKSHSQILESVISLVLAVESNYNPHCEPFLPILIDLITQANLSGQDWSVRKMAIDVLYTFAAILKEPLSVYKRDLIEVMNLVRTDKVKPVREAAIEAM